MVYIRDTLVLEIFGTCLSGFKIELICNQGWSIPNAITLISLFTLLYVINLKYILGAKGKN